MFEMCDSMRAPRHILQHEEKQVSPLRATQLQSR
jgi:hypothetical protein